MSWPKLDKGVRHAESHAHRLLTETDIPAEVFYCLICEGMPVDLRALLMQNQDVLRRALSGRRERTSFRSNTRLLGI